MSSHPKGEINYAPDPGFAFTRAYVSELWLQLANGLAYTIDGSEITFTYAPLPLYRAYLKFQPNFWAWNSNHYSLNWIVEWNYEVINPGDPEDTYFLHIGYAWNPTTLRHAIIARTINQANNFYEPLPARNAPYWSPPDPGSF